MKPTFTETNLQDFVGKVIQFTDKVLESESDFSPKMKARIRKVEIQRYEDGDHCLCIYCDFREFEQENMPFMEANYWPIFSNDPEIAKYGHDKGHLVRWCDTSFYPETKISRHWFMMNDPDFEIIEEPLCKIQKA